MQPFLSGFLLLLLGSCSADYIPTDLGVQKGFLNDCPSYEGCIASQASNPDKEIEPIDYEGMKMQRARMKLRNVFMKHRMIKIITEKKDYYYITYKRHLVTNDIEFYFSKRSPVIHIRSRSRPSLLDFGHKFNLAKYWDFRNNRGELEEIIELFYK